MPMAGRVDHPNALGNHFRADPVSGDHGDAVDPTHLPKCLW
jgi:hypothetical protein